MMVVAALVALGAGASTAQAASGIHKIRHVVVIMQENRSFDNYFGTFPGADGIPMHRGKPSVCVPDPLRHRCMRPYHDSHDVDYGGPHDAIAFDTDYDHGKMDGFIRARESCTNALDPKDCIPSLPPDMMGYHDQREIPNY
jgi:phospholipase C